MIIGNINDTVEIEVLHPLFAKAFEWVRGYVSSAHSDIEAKRAYIDGENLFVNIDTAMLRSKEEQILELHHKYIDIHIPISTTEIIGWYPANELSKEIEAYDNSLDRAFYGDTPKAYYTLNPRDFCIMFPQDAHAPIIGDGEIKKLCVKIRV